MNNRETYGEKHIKTLLSSLPKSLYSIFPQPRLVVEKYATQPDFVVVDHRRGVITVEVKDWVKIKSGNQQQITIEKRDGSIYTEENPFNIVRRYVYDLNTRFEKRHELWEQYRGKSRLKFPWLGIVALPNIPQRVIQQFEQEGIWDHGAVFGKESFTDTQSLEQALDRLQWVWNLEKPLDQITRDIIRGVIDPFIVVADAEGNDIGTLNRTQAELVREPLLSAQAQQLDLFDTDPLSEGARDAASDHSIRLVRGVAGSGKTLVLLYRARFLLQHYPDSKVMLLTFNTDLAESLHSRFSDVEIINFHKICSKIIGKRWHSPIKTEGWIERYAIKAITETGLSAEFMLQEFNWRKEMEIFDNNAYLQIERKGRGQALSVDKRRVINDLFDQYRDYQRSQQQKFLEWMDWADVPLRTLEILQHEGSSLRGIYDIILIDEAQDFAPSWIKVVKELLKPNGSLFICDDPTQSLFRYFSWRQKGIEVVGRTRILRIPYRCTRHINLAAYSLIDADTNLSKEEEVTRPDLESGEIIEGELPGLFRCSSLNDEIQFIKEEIKELGKSGISPSQIAVLCHSKNIIKHWANLRENGIYVEHFEKMKGLEFQAVFIPHLHTSFMHITDSIDVSNERRRIFTAMTRARYRLYMSHHGNLPSQLEPINEHVWRENI